MQVLKFIGGKRGGVIARLPSGKVALVNRKARVSPRPGETWVCRVDFEKERFAVVTPVEKVVCKEVKVVKRYVCGHTVETVEAREVPESCEEVVEDVDTLCDECYKKAREVEHEWDEECLKIFFSEFRAPEVEVDRDSLEKLERELERCEEELKRKIEDIRENARIIRDWREERPICIEYSGFFHDDDYREVKASVIVSEVEYEGIKELVEVFSDVYSEERVIEKFIEIVKEKLPEYRRYRETRLKYIDTEWEIEACESKEITKRALMDPMWKNLYVWLKDPGVVIGEGLSRAFERTFQFAKKLKNKAPFAEIPDTLDAVKKYIWESIMYEITPPTDFRAFDELSEGERLNRFAKIIRLAKFFRKTF